jgi:hypothetical protein
MTVEKTVDADVFSGSDILKAICELNAVFGCIDNEGNFKYIPFIHEGGLYPEEDLFPADDLYPNDGFDVIVSGSPYSYVSGSFVYEDYVVQRITGLAIVEDESDTSELYGTDENLYMITGNYLLFGKNATDLRTVAENFLGFVGRFQYKPARIRMRAMPWVELGDIIGVVGKKGNAVFPILKRTMSGITALYDDYEAQGKEYYSFSANTVSSMVEKLKSKTMRIVANVDEISSELIEYERQTDGTLESHSSLIQQNADQILLRVEKNGVISSINQSAEQVQISASKIDLQGYVTVTDLSGSGTTIINGSNITTGTINSVTVHLSDSSTGYFTKIDTGTGNLSWNMANSSMATNGKITLTGGTIGGFTIGTKKLYWGTTSGYCGAIQAIDDSDTATYALAIGSPSHNSYAPAKFKVKKDGDFSIGGTSGAFGEPYFRVTKDGLTKIADCDYINFGSLGRYIRWGVTDQMTSNYYFGVSTSNNMQLVCDPVGNKEAHIYLKANETQLSIDDYANAETNHFRPTTDDDVSLGSGNHRWTTVYAVNSQISTSDKTTKIDVREIDDTLENIFLETPTKTFYRIGGDRRHIGTLAQDVEEIIEKYGLTTLDFAPICKDVKTKTTITDDGETVEENILDENGEEQYIYGFRYEEYVMLTVHMVQKLYDRVKELEEKVNG